MNGEPFLEKYTGQSTDDLIAFESAIGKLFEYIVQNRDAIDLSL